MRNRLRLKQLHGADVDMVLPGCHCETYPAAVGHPLRTLRLREWGTSWCFLLLPQCKVGVVYFSRRP